MIRATAVLLCGVSAAFGCSVISEHHGAHNESCPLKNLLCALFRRGFIRDACATSLRVDVPLKGGARVGDVLSLPCTADLGGCRRPCPHPGSRLLENFVGYLCGSLFHVSGSMYDVHPILRHIGLSTGHAIGALEGRCPLPGPDGFSERHPCDCYLATACPTSFGCTAQSQTACLTDCAAHHTAEACRHHVVERDCAWVDGACRQRKCSEFTDRGGCELADCEWSSAGYCALPECRRYNESACPLGRCQVMETVWGRCGPLHCTDMSDRDFCEDQFPRCTWGNAGCVLTDCSSLPQKSLCSRARQCGWTDATSSCDEMSRHFGWQRLPAAALRSRGGVLLCQRV